VFNDPVLQVLSINPAAASASLELTRYVFRISDRAVNGNYSQCFALVGECEVVGV